MYENKTYKPFYGKTKDLLDEIKSNGIVYYPEQKNQYKTMQIGQSIKTDNDYIKACQKIFVDMFGIDEEKRVHCFGVREKKVKNDSGIYENSYYLTVDINPNSDEFKLGSLIYEKGCVMLREKIKSRLELLKKLSDKYGNLDNNEKRVDRELDSIDQKTLYFFKNFCREELELLYNSKNHKLLRSIISEYYPNKDITKELKYGLTFNVVFDPVSDKENPTRFYWVVFDDNGNPVEREIADPKKHFLKRGSFKICKLKGSFGKFQFSTGKEKVLITKPKANHVWFTEFVRSSSSGYTVGEKVKNLTEEMNKLDRQVEIMNTEGNIGKKRKREEDDIIEKESKRRRLFET